VLSKTLWIVAILIVLFIAYNYLYTPNFPESFYSSTSPNSF
jgi:multisubunit Na+/H+ antiporter MnhB subunit